MLLVYSLGYILHLLLETVLPLGVGTNLQDRSKWDMGRRVISSSLFNMLNLGYYKVRVSKNAVWEAKEEKYGPKGD